MSEPRDESARHRKRIDQGRFPTYEEARIVASSMVDQDTLQIRRRADGFHIYRREYTK